MTLFDSELKLYQSIVNRAGESIQYTPHGGVPVTIRAAVNRDARHDANMDAVMWSITVMASDIPDPQYQEEITIDGETFFIFRSGKEQLKTGKAGYTLPIYKEERKGVDHRRFY